MITPIEDSLRVVVKFRDGMEPPYGDQVEANFDERHLRQWRRLMELFPGISIRRMYTSVEPGRIRELVEEATRRDANYRPPNFLTYFVVYCPPTTIVEDLVNALSGWDSVQTAYFDPPGGEPTVDAVPNQFSFQQGYLDAAPGGIDARFAWGSVGGDGALQDFVDLERGWTLNHKDLRRQGAQLLHGSVLAGSQAHGTAVLGVVCAVDNDIGVVGIAPHVGSVNVVSSYGSTRPDAIVAAIDHLPYGGVLLLEAQLPNVTIAGAFWASLPIEALDAEFDAIELATARGITVVEAAGNGDCDLDGFALLKRGGGAFRDSGAIMVGAATFALPHARVPTSNFGSRIDCYAWGEHVYSCTSSPIDSYAYFAETSSAAAIIAGAALVAQGIAQENLPNRLNAFQMRAVLSNPATGTASQNPIVDRIGVMPNLRAVINSGALGP